MKRGMLVVAVVAAVLVGCGGSADSDKYKQSWSQPYDKTDCQEWAKDMDEHQRFVMAADLLLTLQRKQEAGAAIPSDALVDRFVTALDEVCDDTDAAIAAEDRPVLEMAPLAYLADDSFRP